MYLHLNLFTFLSQELFLQSNGVFYSKRGVQFFICIRVIFMVEKKGPLSFELIFPYIFIPSYWFFSDFLLLLPTSHRSGSSTILYDIFGGVDLLSLQCNVCLVVLPYL